MTELTFKSDMKHRKQYFTGLHFSHPAKMHLSLQLWLIDKYTNPGEVILDPMAGSGTILVACMMGRHVVTVELEDKFVSMQQGNWEKIRQRGPMLGYEMGQATILQGDARDMRGILADKIISSPPYEESMGEKHHSPRADKLASEKSNPTTYTDAIISSPPYGNRLSDDVIDDNDPQRMPYRQSIDKIITSPPYAEAQTGGGIAKNGYTGDKHSPTDLVGKRSYMPDVHGEANGQIGNLTYGSIDKVITSPPYENQIHKGSGEWSENPDFMPKGNDYVKSNNNIGNLKGSTYLEAMLLVYQNCYSVLKQGGLLLLVTKNFIRDKKEIRLDEDTIKLCEQAGFTLQERHYRKLTSQSFWRTIYQQKYPDAPVLSKEDILVFSKGVLA